MMLIRSSIALINIWIIVLVIVLHGLTVWAVASVDRSKPLKTKAIKPQVIQLQLVTLATNSPNIKPNPKAESKAEPVDHIKPTLPLVEPVASDEPLTSKPKAEEVEPINKDSKLPQKAELQDRKFKNTKLKESQSERNSQTAEEMKAAVSTQVLIIEETKIIIRSNATDEVDLEAMIRAVTAQYNRDQARQRREGLTRDANKRLGDNKVSSKEDKSNIEDEVEAVNFLEAQASWLGEAKPVTDLPSALWLHTSAQSGVIFTVIVELHVDKNGVITEVQLLQSSGEQIIDVAAMVQVRAGQLKPFLQDGLVVNGVVPMTLNYVKP